MYSVDELFELIRTNHIKAKNIVLNEGRGEWGICFNFLNIPETPITLMTATIMKSGRKLAGLPTDNFKLAMMKVEDRLAESDKEYAKSTSFLKSERVTAKVFDEWFVPTWTWMDDDWYKQVKVHRCYFVPQNSIRIILKHMIVNEMLEDMNEQGIKEISLRIPKHRNQMPDNGICGNFYMNTYPKPKAVQK